MNNVGRQKESEYGDDGLSARTLRPGIVIRLRSLQNAGSHERRGEEIGKDSSWIQILESHEDCALVGNGGHVEPTARCREPLDRRIRASAVENPDRGRDADPRPRSIDIEG